MLGCLFTIIDAIGMLILGGFIVVVVYTVLSVLWILSIFTYPIRLFGNCLLLGRRTEPLKSWIEYVGIKTRRFKNV